MDHMVECMLDDIAQPLSYVDKPIALDLRRCPRVVFLYIQIIYIGCKKIVTTNNINARETDEVVLSKISSFPNPKLKQEGDEERHKCVWCYMTFPTVEENMLHSMSCSKLRVPKVSECKICRYRTRIRSNFKRHLLVKHGSEALRSSECSSTYKEHRCECGKSYRHQESLTAHKKLGVCRRSQQFTCPHCSFTANKLVRMKSHMYYSARFPCHQCPREYKNKSHLQRHLKYECGKPPQFHCPLCPYSAKLNFNLKSHLRVKHALIKPDHRDADFEYYTT
ncbi:hypothetical protein GE061_003404 [Apolygus lucorum]|uniref:C2H2-type domain-containing protein n=1 Tax=Apolygus lucorum TaxID=248454 RepID=A0A8S9X1Y9_APOLU|nr:hypothetical protein GE061_003404 [Apolygus lucorum]